MSTKKTATRAMPKDFQDLVRRIKRSETFDQEELRAQIADQISCIMKAQGLTNSEMAKRLRTSRAYVSKILQGNANFTLDSLVQIGRVLGCKYIPLFVPVDAWKQIEEVQFSASAESSASPAKSFEVEISVEATTEIR